MILTYTSLLIIMIRQYVISRYGSLLQRNREFSNKNKESVTRIFKFQFVMTDFGPDLEQVALTGLSTEK